MYKVDYTWLLYICVRDGEGSVGRESTSNTRSKNKFIVSALALGRSPCQGSPQKTFSNNTYSLHRVLYVYTPASTPHYNYLIMVSQTQTSLT